MLETAREKYLSALIAQLIDKGMELSHRLAISEEDVRVLRLDRTELEGELRKWKPSLHYASPTPTYQELERAYDEVDAMLRATLQVRDTQAAKLQEMGKGDDNDAFHIAWCESPFTCVHPAHKRAADQDQEMDNDGWVRPGDQKQTDYKALYEQMRAKADGLARLLSQLQKTIERHELINAIYSEWTVANSPGTTCLSLGEKIMCVGGHAIWAIKSYRNRNNVNLHDAKKAIDEWIVSPECMDMATKLQQL